MHSQSSKTSGNRSQVSGFQCLFVFSLLMAAFAFTSLHAQTRVYVANENDNTVSVIDTSTNTVVATIPVGATPTGVAVSPDGTRAFVSNSNGNSVSVIDTSTNTVTATINNIPQPFVLSITPDGKNLYVPASATFPGIVDVVDTATNAVSASVTVPSQPIAVAITPDGARAYCLSLTGSGPDFGAVSVIDTASNTVVAGPISVPWFALAAPSSMAITPAGDFVYVSGAAFDVVSVISTATNTVSATVSLPSGSFPFALAITPDGSKVYVPNVGTNSVSIIDTATNTLEAASIPVGNGPGGVAITPDGAFAYVTNFNNTVSVIATATNTVIATVPVGNGPLDLAIANLSVPFASFPAPTPSNVGNPNRISLSGSLSLGANGTLDFANQPMTLTVGGFSLLFPPGTVAQVGNSSKQHFNFSGTLNGLSVTFDLIGNSPNFTYSFIIQGKNVKTQVGPNPVTVTLKIGRNSGSSTVNF